MKKIIFLTIYIIGAFIIIGQVRGIISLWHKQDVLLSTEKKLDGEKKENQKLQDQLKVVQSPDFLEQEARDKLFLAKPGEQDVVINQDLLSASPAAQRQEEAIKPYWQQWLSLFF